MHHTVYVALGSNLGEREAHIAKAQQQIAALEGVGCVRASSIYETEPMGPQNQPDYLNAVCCFEYLGLPRHLLSDLQGLEAKHGRIQAVERWTARPLDLDILLFGNQLVNYPELIIPHIGIAERSFVLWPLQELNPDLVIPGKGPVADLIARCPPLGIVKKTPG